MLSAVGRQAIRLGVRVVIASISLAATSLASVGVLAAEDTAVTTALPVNTASIACDGANPAGLVPSQVGERYDLDALWEAGHTGQGVRVALIEVGTSID